MIIDPIKTHYALNTYLIHCLECCGKPKVALDSLENDNLTQTRRSNPSGIRGNEKS